MPTRAAKAKDEAATPVKPAPRGSYAERAAPAYKEAKQYVFAQLPALMGVVMRVRGLSIHDIGTLMGLSDSAVRHRLYGRTEMSASEMIGLAAALELDPRAFYDPSFPIESLIRPRLT